MPNMHEHSQGAPSLHPEFVENMVRTFNDSQAHGVHLLFNEWWAYAPAETIERYLANFKSIPGADAFLQEAYIAEPNTMESLRAFPEDSIGHAYFEFLSGNGLETNLATNYGSLHDHMISTGRLDRMPEELKYAIVRGFQVHDILHVITGYTPSGLDELALQAFSLAQLQFPYFAMWMSVSATQMTFLQPDAIIPVMDAMSSGWNFGRSVENLAFERWEERFSEPLAEVRPLFGIKPEGMATV